MAVLNITDINIPMWQAQVQAKYFFTLCRGNQLMPVVVSIVLFTMRVDASLITTRARVIKTGTHRDTGAICLKVNLTYLVLT